MTHGWPGSIVELLKVIDPLTDPTAHGGSAADAFHLVIPSMPGYGFSGKPQTAGWDPDRIATAWQTLMARLGYDRYVSQGGDWGAVISDRLAKQRPAWIFKSPTPEIARPRRCFARLADFRSPPPDAPHHPADAVFENPSRARHRPRRGRAPRGTRGEGTANNFNAVDISVPAAITVFPGEIYQAPRSWAERAYHKLIYFNKVDKGGHFAAWEEPALFSTEIRAAFRSLR